MEMKDGLGLFFKASIVDGGKGLELYFFTFFIFMFVIFWDLLLLKEGWGESGVWGFFIKNHFLLLTFLIVCKFFVITFHFQMRKGRGMGLRSINISCIY
jgi:hypothetical protein